MNDQSWDLIINWMKSEHLASITKKNILNWDTKLEQDKQEAFNAKLQ